MYGAAPDRPLGVDLLTDQQAGATIMWLIGDFIGLIAGGIVLAQWLRARAAPDDADSTASSMRRRRPPR